MKRINIKSPRRAALYVLGWLHCGLLAAIVFAAFFDMLQGLSGLEMMAPEPAFFRGLLLVIPTGLCWLAIKRLRALWQFLFAAIGLCALSWLFTGHPGGAAFMLLMCVIRVRSRLAEEDEGPVISLFDTPSYFGLLVFVVAFLASGGMAGGFPRLQWLSVLGAVLYLLVCLGYNGLDRLDDYLALNRDMYGLPAKRIQHIAGSALLVGVLLTAVLLLPMAVVNTGFVRVKLPEFKSSSGDVEFTAPTPAPAQPEMDFSDLMPEGVKSYFHIPPIVGYIFFGLIIAALIVGMVMAIVHLFKDFRRSFTDSRDVVQYLSPDEKEHAEELVETLRKPKIWDRSVSATIRRKYRKALLKAPSPPESWMTPAEAESSAGIDVPALHRIYEKARYGREECTQEDLKELR